MMITVLYMFVSFSLLVPVTVVGHFTSIQLRMKMGICQIELLLPFFLVVLAVVARGVGLAGDGRRPADNVCQPG